VVAGFHCRLEVLPGFEFLSCYQQPGADKAPAHHEKDCGDDGCASVELDCYKTEQAQNAPLTPLLALVAFLSPLPEPDLASVVDRPVGVSASPPELPKIWRFSQRTALPPRAPSFAS
jgi:hypothetical protein